MIKTEVVNTFKYHISNEFVLPNPPATEREFHQNAEWINRRFNCSLKDTVLNTVMQNEGLKLSELFEKTSWDNYSSFKSEVSTLCKKGYLVKSGKCRNYRYYITDEGRFHAQNPTYELNSYYSKLQSHSEKLTLNGLARIVRNMDDASLDRFVRTLMDSVNLETLIEELANDEYFEMKSNYDSLLSTKQFLESSISALHEAKISLEKEIAITKTTIDSLEKNVENYKDTVSIHENTLSILENGVSNYKKQIEDYEEEIELLESDNNELENYIDEMESEITVKGGEMASYEKKLIEKDECIEELEKSLESAHMEISELQDGIISDEAKQELIEKKKKKLVFIDSRERKRPVPKEPSGHGGTERTKLIQEYLNAQRCDAEFYDRLQYFYPYRVTAGRRRIDRIIRSKGDVIVSSISSASGVQKNIDILEKLQPHEIDEWYSSYIIVDENKRQIKLEFVINGNGDTGYVLLQTFDEYNHNLDLIEDV